MSYEHIVKKYKIWLKEKEEDRYPLRNFIYGKVIYVKSKHRGSEKYFHDVNVRISMGIKYLLKRFKILYLITLKYPYEIQKNNDGKSYITYEDLTFIPHIMEKDFKIFKERMRILFNKFQYIKTIEVDSIGRFVIHLVIGTNTDIDKKRISDVWNYICEIDIIDKNKKKEMTYYDILEFLHFDYMDINTASLCWFLNKKQYAISQGIMRYINKKHKEIAKL